MSFESELAVTRSILKSPLKSPTAMSTGPFPGPVLKLRGLPKVPPL
jgi:hypothetical protein